MGLRALVFIIIFIFQLSLALYSQFPTTITPDAAMHAEIVEIIKTQGFVRTWEPYAPNEFTYPPLFHYLAFGLTLFGLSAIDAVRALGIVVWLMFPVATYLLVGTYNKCVVGECEAGGHGEHGAGVHCGWGPVVAAMLIAVVPSFSNIFIYGEFPQLLAMLLFVWQWYALRKGRYVTGAVLCGLTFLTHVFVPLVSILLLLYYFPRMVRRCRICSLKYPLIVFIVALPWVPRYIIIIQNALLGAWENAQYNAVQPVFGFWPAETIIDWLFGVHGLTVFMVPLALLGFFRVKDRWLRLFFAFGLVFTVFHIPFTQLKIYDLFVLPVIVLASAGIVEVVGRVGVRLNEMDRFGVERRKGGVGVMGAVAVVALVVVMGVLQVQHFQNAWVNWFNPEIAPTPELADAAQWLGEHDKRAVRIYAHQASAWAGVLSGKLPLNPDINYVEAFSEEYKKQLYWQQKMRKLFLEGGNRNESVGDYSDAAREYDVLYLLLPLREEIGGLRKLYNNGVWAVYEPVGQLMEPSVPVVSRVEAQDIMGRDVYKLGTESESDKPTMEQHYRGTLRGNTSSSSAAGDDVSDAKNALLRFSHASSVWVWNDELELDSSASVEELISFAADNYIDTLYVGVDEDAFAGIFLVQFLEMARERGVSVYYLNGDPSWAAAEGREVLLRVIGMYEGFAREHPGLFAGVHLDIERADWFESDAIVAREFLENLRAVKEKYTSVGLSLDVPFWLDSHEASLPFAFDGRVEKLDVHLRQFADFLTIMDYRNYARGEDGIIENVRGEISHGKTVVGVEFGDVAPEKITFYGHTADEVVRELRIADKEFESNENFEGFAFHSYKSLMEFLGRN